MKQFKSIFSLLNSEEKLKCALLMVLIVMMAIIDMIGIGSIMPFVAIIANPELINEYTLFVNAYDAYSNIIVDGSKEGFVFLFGFAVFCIFLFSLLFKAFATAAYVRFSMLREYSIQKRLVHAYLGQDYQWFLQRHTSDLGKNLLSEVSQVVHLALVPAMNIIANTAVVVSLLLLLLFVDFQVASITVVIFGGGYLAVYFFTSRKVKVLGQERKDANEQRFKQINETFGAVKEIKISRIEEKYINSFLRPAHVYAKHQSTITLIGILPKFALEGLAFGGVLIFVLALQAEGSNLSNFFPLITIFVLAGYRIMPAVQNIYGSFTQLQYSGPAVEMLRNDLLGLENKLYGYKNMPKENIVKEFRQLKLCKVNFAYEGASSSTLHEIDVTVEAGQKIAFIGGTGSGKSTILDLMLGVLSPGSGYIKFSGLNYENKEVEGEFHNFGYVPQKIYLADDTIAANIALGTKSNNIDLERVIWAADVAQILEFVTNELEDGFDTLVGERGVRLSGGQQQRIGIARALYSKPSVLLLDEATSALDNDTEKKLLQAMERAVENVTIISVAHRLTTVKNFDKIYVLEKGCIVEVGAFENLKHKSANIG